MKNLKLICNNKKKKSLKISIPHKVSKKDKYYLFILKFEFLQVMDYSTSRLEYCRKQ